MRPSTRTTVSLLVIGLTAAMSMAACLDATPVEVAPLTIDTTPTQTPTTVDDAATDALDATPTLTCEACLGTAGHLGPGCPDVVGKCESNPICSTAYHCAINSGCLKAKTTDVFISCALGCADEAGLVDYSDPAFAEMYAIFTCASAGCAGSCQFSKGADAAIH